MKIIYAIIITTLLNTASAALLDTQVDKRSVDKVIDQLMLEDLVTLKGEPLILRVNSPGGGVFEGFRLINKMNSIKASGRKITVRVTGMCASMCFTILQAASTREAHPLALFLPLAPLWVSWLAA